jgi:hypothetical protein
LDQWLQGQGNRVTAKIVMTFIRKTLLYWKYEKEEHRQTHTGKPSQSGHDELQNKQPYIFTITVIVPLNSPILESVSGPLKGFLPFRAIT